MSGKKELRKFTLGLGDNLTNNIDALSQYLLIDALIQKKIILSINTKGEFVLGKRFDNACHLASSGNKTIYPNID